MWDQKKWRGVSYERGLELCPFQHGELFFGAVTTVSDGLSIETNIQCLTGDIDIYLKTLYR